MLRDGWPLIFSGLIVMIYMRIDQMMLGEMIDETAVGNDQTWFEKIRQKMLLMQHCY